MTTARRVRERRADAAAQASALAAPLREGSVSRWLRSRPTRGTLCPLGCEGKALSSVTFGVGGSQQWPVRLAGSELGVRGGDSPGKPAVHTRERRPLSAALGRGRGGSGRPRSPGSGLALPLDAGALAGSSERSLLEEAAVRVPVSGSCFSFFPPQQTFWKFEWFFLYILITIEYCGKRTPKKQTKTREC